MFYQQETPCRTLLRCPPDYMYINKVTVYCVRVHKHKCAHYFLIIIIGIPYCFLITTKPVGSDLSLILDCVYSTVYTVFCIPSIHFFVIFAFTLVPQQSLEATNHIINTRDKLLQQLIT